MMRLPFYARLALTLFAIALILLFMWIGKSVLVPLFFSFLASILLHPVVVYLEKRRFPRVLAAGITLLRIYGAFPWVILFFHQAVNPAFQGSAIAPGQGIGKMAGCPGLDQ